MSVAERFFTRISAFNLPFIHLSRREKTRAVFSVLISTVQAFSFVVIAFCVRDIFDSALMQGNRWALVGNAGLILLLFVAAHLLDIWNRSKVLALTKE